MTLLDELTELAKKMLADSQDDRYDDKVQITCREVADELEGIVHRHSQPLTPKAVVEWMTAKGATKGDLIGHVIDGAGY